MWRLREALLELGEQAWGTMIKNRYEVPFANVAWKKSSEGGR
jgi:hypothetical protein